MLECNGSQYVEGLKKATYSQIQASKVAEGECRLTSLRAKKLHMDGERAGKGNFKNSLQYKKFLPKQIVEMVYNILFWLKTFYTIIEQIQD